MKLLGLQRWASSKGFCTAEMSWSTDKSLKQSVIKALRARIFSHRINSITSISQLLRYEPRTVAQLFLILDESTVQGLVGLANGHVREDLRRQSLEFPDRISVLGQVDRYRVYERERDFLKRVISFLPTEKQDMGKRILAALPETAFISSYPYRKVIIKP